MIKAEYSPYTLDFTFTAITSRQAMKVKDTYFIHVWDTLDTSNHVVAEVPLFRGLSAEDTPVFEDILRKSCKNPLGIDYYKKYSSIRFGFEAAFNRLECKRHDSEWSQGHSPIRINGLIWMGDKELMAERIEEKLNAGFHCLKLKIGGINFEEEIDLLKYIRSRFPAGRLELRLDANGSFTSGNALKRLEALSRYSIHSLEQPVKAGQPEEMARICSESPIDIALDEELIGVTGDEVKRQLLAFIRPHYIILKPALCGGFMEANRWIYLAESLGIGWWATSALESNIGLYDIADWVSSKKPAMVQGLGTGSLYSNNIDSPMVLRGEELWLDPKRSWGSVPVNFIQP